MTSSRKPTLQRAFTLIEVLVVLGVAAILLSLAVPMLSRSSGRARAAVSLSNIRQIGIAVSQYAADFRDHPPAVGGPARAGTPWEFSFGTLGRGEWFEHKWLYSFAVAPYIGDPRVLIAPGPHAKPPVYYETSGYRATVSDYMITNTLYASPKFFDWSTQQGAEQFGLQKLSAVQYPSNKGVLYQPVVYHLPQYGSALLSCCALDIPSPIVFADISASEHVMRRLSPGIWNAYEPGGIVPGVNPQEVPGVPVANTTQGILGRDR